MTVNWLEFWYAALGSLYGVSITVSNAEGVRQALYRARASAGDPDLDGLQIRLRSSDELWIVKGDKHAAQGRRTA